MDLHCHHHHCVSMIEALIASLGEGGMQQKPVTSKSHARTGGGQAPEGHSGENEEVLLC